MIIQRPAAERGHANHGWLDTYHTFSFADYHDPAWTHFGPLRVINEDRIAGGGGFGMHPHRDMEILTWVLSGALKHEDSLGNAEVLKPGELQRISAGTGVMHSEHNYSPVDPVHLLQIWIVPAHRGEEPRYEQTSFADAVTRGGLVHLATGSADAKNGAMPIHQDAEVYVARLQAGEQIERPLAPSRRAWIQVARGSVALNDVSLVAGDGAGVRAESSVRVTAVEPSEVLLFDLG